MAWPNPFQRHDENTRTAWGYTFQWGPEHWSSEQMKPLKHSYDVLGEDCLNRLDEISPPQSSELPRNKSRGPAKDKDATEKVVPKRDLYELLRENASKDERLGELWEEVNAVPEWVDWDQIDRGQQVFYRYGGVALNALAFQSLLGGMGANRVVETLARTGGFGVKVARHRMFETTQHVLQCTNSLESIKPGGAGHKSSVRVRLLHAAVRRRIMKLAKERPEYFDVEPLGVPINDLDSIATISTFSSQLIWLGFPRQGIWLRKQEILDYLALWRLISHYVGAPTDIFKTPELAKAFMESLVLNEIHPTETSKLLANNIILSLQGQPPTYASRDFLNASARWLNGNELANGLGIGKPSLYYSALVFGQCIFFMCLCYSYRSVPSWDQYKIARLRKIFYAVIIDNKTHGLGAETNFDFKYIPDFHSTTAPGEYEESGLKEPGIERRNLQTLLISTTVVGIVSWLGLRISMQMFGRLLGY